MNLTRYCLLSATFGLLSLVSTGCGGGLRPSMDGVDSLLEATTTGDFDAAVAAAEDAWSRRIEEAAVLEAIAEWERALALETAESVDRTEAISAIYTRLAAARFWLGHAHLSQRQDTREERDLLLSTHEAGAEAAQRALALQNPEWLQRMQAGETAESSVHVLRDTDVPAAFWLALNTGKIAQSSGMLTGLRLKDEINALMTRVSELQPAFFYHGPDRYFGAYNTRLPIGNPDMDAARSHFEAAIEGAPEFLESRVVFVEEWASRADDRELAAEQLQAVLDFGLDSAPQIRPENENAQRRAADILANFDEYFP